MLTQNVSAEKKLVYFTSIDRAEFRRPVLPGDQVRFEIDLLQLRGRNCRMHAMAFVQDKLAAEAELSCMVVDRESPNLPPGLPVATGE